MSLSKSKISIVRYAVTKCEVISPNLKDNYPVPLDSIGDIIIENDYENYLFPYFHLNLTLPSGVIRAIKKTPLDIHISIAIDKQYFSVKNGETDPTIDSTTKYISKTYIAYIEKQDRSLLDSTNEIIEEGLDYGIKTVDPETNDISSFTLYDEDLVNALGVTVNDIISNGCLIDILTYVLNTAGISNVLISPPNNYKSYRQFILPPLDASDHIDIICNDYGIHSKGSLIFFGLDRNYIIDKIPKCTAYTVNEYQTTYLYYGGRGYENLAFAGGCIKNDTENANYILIQPTSFRFTDKSIAAENAIASDVTILDPLNGGSGSGTYTMRIGGDDTRSAIVQNIASYKKTISIGLKNVDLDMLTPNKHFVVTIDDIKYQQYNGSYMLVKCVSTLAKDGPYYTPITLCEFRS